MAVNDTRSSAGANGVSLKNKNCHLTSSSTHGGVQSRLILQDGYYGYRAWSHMDSPSPWDTEGGRGHPHLNRQQQRDSFDFFVVQEVLDQDVWAGGRLQSEVTLQKSNRTITATDLSGVRSLWNVSYGFRRQRVVEHVLVQVGGWKQTDGRVRRRHLGQKDTVWMICTFTAFHTHTRRRAQGSFY